MKKVILSAMALFAFGFANAQDATEGKGFAKGSVFASGTVGYRSESTGDVKDNTFTIAPGVGFFVTDNIAIGGQIAYLSNTQEDGVAADLKTNVFAFGAFGRYYGTPASDFSFFGELGAAYLTGKREQGPFEAKTTGFTVAVAPGVSYFLGKNFAIEAKIGALSYGTTKPDGAGAESTNTFDLNLNLQDITFGAVYKF